MLLVNLEAPKKVQGTYLWTHFCSHCIWEQGGNKGE